ncbi:nucleolar protein 58-like [Patiria miniata]|uniref:Nucleolar protein 58 n=1 Tax=Patiria miniata TaxID=46514 RepID=A0A913ZBI2_PATMI|nr:nucleolar protein 58-like [Patiria miniata]
MLVLFESPAGFAVFKLLDEKKLLAVDNLYKDFASPEGASRIVKLKQFEKFQDTTEALAAATATVEGKLGKGLKKILKKIVAKDAHSELAVADAKLGGIIKEKVSLTCVHNSAIAELMRGIRSQFSSLVPGLPERELTAMTLGLAHSLSRYKLKFSPDKVDTMIVQAISLLDDLDKELNNYIMRCREWYGWHFPELGKIVTDNLAFAKVVKFMGDRTKAASLDFSDILPEDLEEQVKLAAEISMGTEISEEDFMNIHYLCEQVIEITEYRAQLYDYLKNRMQAIAPNLTTMVGELVGARLISHAGSLMNLAKHPSSTVQILGAEKALFRALKTKKDTPKYGLIYHASLVGQTNPKNKGKVSRMLAAKTSLAIRVDALGEDNDMEIGIQSRAKVEARLRQLEEGTMHRISGTGKAKARTDKYEHKSEIRTYNQAQDSTLPSVPKKRKFEDEDGDDQSEAKPDVKRIKAEAQEEGETETPEKKKKKKKKKMVEEVDTSTVKVEPEEEPEEAPSSEKKKKKKRKRKSEGEAEADTTLTEPETPSSERKKKKKKKE